MIAPLSPNNPSDGSYLTETKADDYLLSLEADVEADAVAKDLHEAYLLPLSQCIIVGFAQWLWPCQTSSQSAVLPNYQTDPLLHQLPSLGSCPVIKLIKTKNAWTISPLNKLKMMNHRKTTLW